MTLIEAPEEQQYFLKKPILELGAKGDTELPLFQGPGVRAKVYLPSSSLPFFLSRLQLLHLFTASRAKLCVPLNNTPSVTLPSSSG